MENSYFYKDKPLFGLDIGFNSVKAMQLEKHNNVHHVVGYGVATFKDSAINKGMIIDHESVAKAIQQLFENDLVGEITTKRVAFSVPAARTFSRILHLPKLDKKDLFEAVKLEAEQYIPVPISDLYLDFTIIRKNEKNIDVLAVAVPKKIVDSYLQLARMLGLEAVVMETTTGSTDRLFRYTDQHNVPSVLIDFGSVSADITVYDKYMAVTGTVPGGGDDFTNLIASKLKVTKDEAHLIKIKYGLGASKKQSEIVEAITPTLNQTLKEIKRMIRYYEERSESTKKIEQVVTFGGGANVPGLSEYLINALRIPVRACDPWNHIVFKHIKEPNGAERSMYITAASLGLIDPREIFA